MHRSQGTLLRALIVLTLVAGAVLAWQLRDDEPKAAAVVGGQGDSENEGAGVVLTDADQLGGQSARQQDGERASSGAREEVEADDDFASLVYSGSLTRE